MSTALLSELKQCDERIEQLQAMSIILESLKRRSSSQLLELVSALQEDFEIILDRQRSSLAAAYRIQSRLLEMNPSISAQQERADEVDFEPTRGSVRNAASKPSAPSLEEARINSVVLGMSGPADEYQVNLKSVCLN